MRRTLKDVEREKGNLHEIIPPLVNQRGQSGAANALDLSTSTINSWLKANHYRKIIRYEKEQAS